jgi:hypothetical protein
MIMPGTPQFSRTGHGVGSREPSRRKSGTSPPNSSARCNCSREAARTASPRQSCGRMASRSRWWPARPRRVGDRDARDRARWQARDQSRPRVDDRRRATGDPPRSCGRQVAGTYVGATFGDASEMVFHSDCVMPHFSQRKTTRSPAVRAAHGTVSMVLNSI